MDIALDSFKFVDELGLEFPVMILGTKPLFSPRSDIIRGYKFREPQHWLNIQHQGAGHGCYQSYIQGRVLDVSPIVNAAMKEIHKIYYHTSLGAFGVPFTELLKYHALLNQHLKVDCENNYFDLQESVYPIDVQHLSKLTDMTFPFNLDDLIEFENQMDSIIGSLYRWNIWILAENSD